MSRLNRVQKDHPEKAQNEAVQAVATDIDNYAELRAVAQSQGGKTLMAAELKTIAASIKAICTGATTLPEMELRALALKIDARLSFLKSLTRADTNLKDAEEALAELLTT